MRRRTFLGTAAASLLTIGPAALGGDPSPLELGPGPHLFLDDYLIESNDALRRDVESPMRLEHPVLDSDHFGVTQPYLSVAPDAAGGGLRMWYNRGPAIWHAVSDDGLRWRDPRLAWDVPRGYGCSVIDDGPTAQPREWRYKLASWQATRELEDTPRDDAGIHVGFSPDGFDFRRAAPQPVLPTWPAGSGVMTRHGAGDTVDVYYDLPAKRYAMAVKVHALESDRYPPGPKAGRAIRRLVGLSTSSDFLDWTSPERILVPEADDEGLLEFYGMGGVHHRGDLRIGMVRVLRDDLPCDPGGPVEGIGYTALATSRDGLTWQRMRAPFFDRNPAPGSWDHAMSWIGALVPKGDELWCYYGGYARGHKIAPETERQIGLARMPRDRYAALVPERRTGRLVTPPLLLNAHAMTLNARADGDGFVRVAIAGSDGALLEGFAQGSFARGDQLAAPMRWQRPLADLRGQDVRVHFVVNNARLYGFELR